MTTRTSEFRDGFIAMMPLWLGAVPFALAYALLARSSGVSGLETIAMSTLVFAGSAQLAIVDMTTEQAGYLAILATVLLLNLRHVLYAMTLDRKLARPREVPRPILAAGMTDEGMGLTIAHTQQRPASDWFFMGTVVSLYLAFAIATILGVLLGGRIPDPQRLRLEVIFPLTFLALLLPLLRTKRALLVAVTAGSLSLGLRPVVGPSNAVLLAILGAATVGTLVPARLGRSESAVEMDISE